MKTPQPPDAATSDADLIDGTQRTVEPKLTAGIWREINAWAAVGDAGLPARPALLSPPIVAAILDGQRPSVSAHRFASIPLSATSDAELAPQAGRMLSELLKARRSAA